MRLSPPSETTGMARRLVAPAAIAATLAVALSSPLAGQFSQYTQPGVGAPGPQLVERDFEIAVEEARWKLGPLRVDPWAALRDITWHDNPGGETEQVGSPQSDVSATGGVGVRAYLPTGPKLYWAAHALPEYVWWADRTQSRRWNGRYGVGAFGFFNRLEFQATARRADRLAVISPEVPQEVSSRQDSFGLSTSVALGHSLSLFGTSDLDRIRNLLSAEERVVAAPLDALDRDQSRVRAGVSYQPSDRWRVGAGYEWTSVELEPTARNLDNRGTAPVVELAYTGSVVDVVASAEFRSLEPEPGSVLGPIDTTTAALSVIAAGNRVTPEVYARRTLGFAIDQDYTHFQSDLGGAAVSFVAGRRADIRIFGELGTNDYVGGAPGIAPRHDDVTSFGAEIGFAVWRALRFTAGGSWSTFDSNLPGFDRSLTTVGAGLTIGAGSGTWL